MIWYGGSRLDGEEPSFPERSKSVNNNDELLPNAENLLPNADDVRFLEQDLGASYTAFIRLSK